jgi:type II secretory pathway component PulF
MNGLMIAWLKALLCGLSSTLLASAFAGKRYDPYGEPVHPTGFQALKTVMFWFLIVSFVVLVLLGLLCGLIPGLILLLVGTMVFHRWWTARQHALLWTMAVCAERLIPLGPAIRAFAAERSGILATRADQLADMLGAGVSLPAALDSIPSLVPAEARTKIRVGQEAGALAPAIRDAIAIREDHDPFWNAAVGRLLYILTVLFAAAAIVTFMMFKIIPEFRKIFSEFDRELPWITEVVIGISSLLANYWFLVLLPPLVVLVGISIFAVMRYVGAIGPGARAFGWMERRLVTASILENLALVAQRGRPMVEGVGILAATYPSAAVRGKLAKVLQDIRAGADWCESLTRHRLIGRTELAVLKAAQQVGDLPWALREMADSSRRRQAYRAQIWVGVLFPMTVLAIAVMIGMIVVSFFIPLVSLIQTLT